MRRERSKERLKRRQRKGRDPKVCGLGSESEEALSDEELTLPRLFRSRNVHFDLIVSLKLDIRTIQR